MDDSDKIGACVQCKEEINLTTGIFYQGLWFCSNFCLKKQF